jgi:hypothetical protein
MTTAPRVVHLALVGFALVCALSAPRVASAQGTLSTQGLGFPPGQLSTPAILMGGAIGEVDPLSPINPAAIGLLMTPIIWFQAEPEYREVQVGTKTERTSVARFPLFLGSMPVGSRWGVAVSASTLLDRTWETTVRDTQVVSGDTLAGTFASRSDGSIADLRLAVSYATTSWLRIGVAGHAFSGRDVLRVARNFDDTLRFAADTQRTTLSFGGNAISVGAQTLWPRVGTIGVGYRHGGSFHTYSGNTIVASGSAPDHVGVSLAYLGINGTTLGVRAARDSWSRLRGLSASMNVHEAWDIGVGADVTGPRFGDTPVGLRAGARWRTLPFSADAKPVKERTVSGGFGFPMADRRVELHLGALRATRTSGTATETAWTISTGFAVRP